MFMWGRQDVGIVFICSQRKKNNDLLQHPVARLLLVNVTDKVLLYVPAYMAIINY
jgi:hypothetical protein